MAPFPSVAVTVKAFVAAVLGVPESTPVAGLSVSPAGSAPAVTLNVYVPLPPVADTVCAYGTPIVPLDRLAGFTAIAALMVTVKAREPVAPLPSVAVMVKLLAPTALGVPVMAPVEAFSDRPFGSEPALTPNV